MERADGPCPFDGFAPQGQPVLAKITIIITTGGKKLQAVNPFFLHVPFRGPKILTFFCLDFYFFEVIHRNIVAINCPGQF